MTIDEESLMLPRFIAFLAVSVVIVIVSWPSFRQPRSHGFFRFFVFETALLLVLLNVGYWFADPFTFLHVVSWISLIVSAYLVIHSLLLLRTRGKPEGSFEATTQLVTSGVYRYLRHPMYASLLYLGFGAFLKHISLTSTSMMLALAAFLFATAKVEERENMDRFGPEYKAYCRKTRMFVPFIW